MGFEASHGAGVADDFTDLVEGADVASSAGLDQEVAEDGRFGGTGFDDDAAGVGGELVEETVL